MTRLLDLARKASDLAADVEAEARHTETVDDYYVMLAGAAFFLRAASLNLQLADEAPAALEPEPDSDAARDWDRDTKAMDEADA